jgi:hypothetical protein
MEYTDKEKEKVREKFNNSNFNTKIKEKKIVDKVKNFLGELESLFLEKNRCEKRMNILLNDKKEIITLKNQNIERYTVRLNNLILTKTKIEEAIKNEESLIINLNNNNINTNANLNTNSNLYNSSTNQTLKKKISSDMENSNSIGKNSYLFLS